MTQPPQPAPARPAPPTEFFDVILGDEWTERCLGMEEAQGYVRDHLRLRTLPFTTALSRPLPTHRHGLKLFALWPTQEGADKGDPPTAWIMRVTLPEHPDYARPEQRDRVLQGCLAVSREALAKRREPEQL